MTSKNTVFFSPQRLTVFLLYLIPILVICGLVGYFGVNVPLYDQWILPYWFEKFSSGTLTVKNLFAQHNSHRIFFPKLIFIALSFASGWNILWELYFSIILALLTFLALYRLSQITAQNLTQTSLHLTNLSSCFLLFSWVQHENWLWGFQIAIFLINFCVVLSCLILSTPSLKPPVKLTISALLCSIASFTSAQGLLSWLAMIPSVWTIEGSIRHTKQRLLVWLGLFLFSGFIYSINYRQETDTVPVVVSDHKIFATIHFFLNLLATPFLDSTHINWLMGLIIFLVFLGLTLAALFSFKSEQLIRNLSPWISISLFSLLCSALIAVGRSGLGTDYAILASRYTTHAILLPIAILQLSPRIIFNPTLNFITISRSNQLLIFGLLTGIFLSLNLVRSANAVVYVNSRFTLVQSGKTCFNLINYLEQSAFFKTSPQSCFSLINSSQWRELIWDSAEKLNRLNFRKFAQNVAFIETPQQTYGEITSPQPFTQVINISTTESVQLQGWINPTKNPHIVLFSLTDKPTFFANAYAINSSEPPLNPNQLSSKKLLTWEVEFSADVLPIGTSIIHAWIYDSTENQFIQLNHQVSLQVFDSTSLEE
ncbi:putative membrane protein [Lyngbya aestuarii BL J]|uniref:Putative membrane protein n=1 Tax=Lyngbya aestuarii BL J TaxID=1348334 RepID=U7QFE1_9CYAN|nr:hypothetical protein [Lyngbya aestuarii]ERT05967.1 putative membrane protein [Lyngbya aestuarii BL J]